MLKAAHWLFLFLIAISLSSCFNIAGDVEYNEVKRIESPDHKIDAVIVTADAGATTSEANHIFIVKSGSKIKKDSQKPVFISDQNSNLTLQWATNKSLVISYYKARIFKYTRFWQDEQVDDKYVVEISLDHKSAK